MAKQKELELAIKIAVRLLSIFPAILSPAKLNFIFLNQCIHAVVRRGIGIQIGKVLAFETLHFFFDG